MTGEQGLYLAYGLVMIGFVASGLVARRVPLARAAKMALAWVLIFALAILLFAARDDIRGVAERVRGEIDPATPVSAGGSLRIAMSDDGHFWVRGRIGTQTVRFLIDSGATTTSLSSTTVAAAGLAPDPTAAVQVRTANGSVRAERVAIPLLEVGGIERRDFGAVTAPAFGDLDVLGMNFLSSLRRWGVEGHSLVLTP